MEKMESKEEKKLNNQGLTLLELLIAVIVLAIIVVPFLNSFVISARSNGRAARTHRATSVAQNIVEGFKAGSLADVMWQMNYPELGFQVVSPDSIEGSLSDSVMEMTRIAGTDGIEYVKSVSSEEMIALYPGADDKTLKSKFTVCDGADGNARHSSIFSADGGKSYEFVPQKSNNTSYTENGKYYFAIKGVRMQGSAFDALICLDSAKYTNAGSLSAEKRYNEEKTVQLTGMDDTKDAIFVQTNTMDDAVIEDLKWNYPTWADLMKTENIERKITVSIEATGDAKPIHKVKVNYLYTFLPDSSITCEREYCIFNNSETGEELRAIYLYYSPWYNLSQKETIEINNGKDSSGFVTGNGSLPVDLYIVKQESGDLGTLNQREVNYKVLLQINDDGKPTDPAVHRSLRTNLEQNLYQAYLPEGSTLPGSTVSYELNGSPVLNIPVVIDPENPAETKRETEVKLNWKEDMAGSEKQDRIYEMTVKIYEEGAADAHFPDEDLLAEMVADRND